MAENSARIISSLIKADVEAATLQCNAGPQSGSNFFLDGIISEEKAPAGLFIMLIRDRLDHIAKNKDLTEQNVNECRLCLSVLKETAPILMPLLLHQSPEAASHVDPRQTITEAWYLTLTALVSVCRKHEPVASSCVNEGVESFLGDSLALASSIIFLKDMGGKKAQHPTLGMSLDGPHTLAIEAFTAESMLLGPSILLAGGASIASKIHVANESLSLAGPAILTASILRGVSGALPPWAVEEMPELFKSMYISLGNNTNDFIQNLRQATKLQASTAFGGVRPGELLASRYLAVSDTHIESFLNNAKDVCEKGMLYFCFNIY